MKQPVYSLDEINQLILDKTGCDLVEITPDIDIDRDLGCTGDDFDELIHDYAKKFNVDMSSYLWYFHTTEEGAVNSIGSMFFKSPDNWVEHIAVTPFLLCESANAGKWLVEYPEHRMPKRRYNLIVNLFVGSLFVSIMIYKCSR